MRFALEHVLFSQDCQRHILKMVKDDLNKLSSVAPRDWLGEPLHKRGGRKRPIQWSLPDIISADRKPEHNSDFLQVDFSEVTSKLCDIIESGTGLHCTFAIILCILLCDNLMDMIVAGTPENICNQYFTGFEYRITKKLCGEMGYESDSKSGRIISPALPPCQIAIEELIFAETIYKSHFLQSAFKKNTIF